MATRDADIRATLHATALAAFREEPETLVLNELGICSGDFRIDVAVVNGALHGWEIKSDRDTLYRLPAQMEAYSRVFDHMTIVVGTPHLVDVLAMVPKWWGVTCARKGGAGPVELERVRGAGMNPGPDPYAVAQLLWREEAAYLLREAGVRGSALKARRRELWAALATAYPFPELAARVRHMIKARGDWRDSTLLQDVQKVV